MSSSRAARASDLVHPAVLVFLVGLAFAGLAPVLLQGQTLEPVQTEPIERFLLRHENGDWVDPYSADFTPAGDNGYLGVWFEAAFQDPAPGRLMGQRFDGDDRAVSEPRPIPSDPRPPYPSPYALQTHRAGGPVLAIWRLSGEPVSNVVGRYLHAQGTPLSPVVAIGHTSTSMLPAAALHESGRALVVWRVDVSGAIRGRILEANGGRGPVLDLTNGDARGPAVAVDANGRHLLVWQEYVHGTGPHFDLFGRWLGTDGRAAGLPFVIATDASGYPEVAMWPDGRSAVVWSSCGGTDWGAPCAMRIRWLDEDGAPVGPPQTISPDDGRSHASPEMAIDSDGVLFVHWQVYPANPGTFPGDVLFHAVAFDAVGARLATAPVLEIKGEVERRKVVALDQDFFVSWYGYNANPIDGTFAMRYRFTPADDGGEEPPPPPPDDPAPPAGAAPLTSPEVPGFRFWVRISTAGGSVLGSMEPVCIPETVCVSGALAGRSEVFLRVVGPRPNGYLWPTIVKFTTSTVEAWIEQIATGEIRYYELEGASQGVDELPGLFDRTGFQP